MAVQNNTTIKSIPLQVYKCFGKDNLYILMFTYTNNALMLFLLKKVSRSEKCHETSIACRLADRDGSFMFFILIFQNDTIRIFEEFSDEIFRDFSEKISRKFRGKFSRNFQAKFSRNFQAKFSGIFEGNFQGFFRLIFEGFFREKSKRVL